MLQPKIPKVNEQLKRTVGNLCQRRNINANVKNGTETK